MDMEEWGDDGQDMNANFMNNNNAVNNNGGNNHQNDDNISNNNSNQNNNNYSNNFSTNYHVNNYNNNQNNNQHNYNTNNANNSNQTNYSNYRHNNFNQQRNRRYVSNQQNSYYNNSNYNNRQQYNQYNQYNHNQYNQYGNNRNYNRNNQNMYYNNNNNNNQQSIYQHRSKTGYTSYQRKQYLPRNNNQYNNNNNNNVNNLNQFNMNDDDKTNTNQQPQPQNITDINYNHNNNNDNIKTQKFKRPKRKDQKKKKRTIENNLDFEQDDDDNDNQYTDNTNNNNNNKANRTIHVDEYAPIAISNDIFQSQHMTTFSNAYNQTITPNNNNIIQNQNQMPIQNQMQIQQNSNSNSYNRTSLDTENLSKRAREMVLQLKNGTYDCMVCQSLIGKKGRVWKCNHCYTIFHLTCVNKWAKAREEKDAETEQRPVRADHLITKLRCPACNFIDNNFKYNEYKCYCNKIIFDQFNRLSYNNYGVSTIPHSCGNICSSRRGEECPHLCRAECHPGPCSKCTLPSKRFTECPCGKLKYSLLCGDNELDKKRECGQICNKLLDCKNHRCINKCHNDNCKQCDITIQSICFCGKSKKLQPCGTGIKVRINPNDKNDNINNNDEKDNDYEWKFSCKKMCGKLLSCGNHKCTLICHSGSCQGCRRRVETITKCACGKNKFPNIKRTSCLDPLPQCKSKCDRMLGCSKHICKKQCHDSKCALCTIQIKKKCRCGGNDKRFKCHDYHKRLKNYINNNINAVILGTQDEWIQCNKTCKRVMSCGVHNCKIKCCKGRTNRTYYDDHQCRKICNKALGCGRHRCSSYCHTGNCNPCGVTYRNGVQCACGNVYVDGPFQCGTKKIPQCTSICDKILNCGHSCSAKCHHGSCPQCLRICSKACLSHDILVHNLPCHVNHRSCGNPCNKLLNKCGYHRCNRSCHNDQCDSKNKNKNKKYNGKGCGQICGLELKCGHQCYSKCHGIGGDNGSLCNSNNCKSQIIVKCKCGNTEEVQYCKGRTEYDLRAVPCTSNCKIAERNKRFREALNIPIKKNPKNNNKNDAKVDNNNNIDNNDIERIPYAAVTLQRILKYMRDDKSHKTIIKNGKEIYAPTFVYYMEDLLKLYINDNSRDAKLFKLEYSDITVLIPKGTKGNINQTNNVYVLNLKPMNSEQRYIVYSMISHYNISGNKMENSGKKSVPYIELIKNKNSLIPNYLLSFAILQYQLYPSQISTLETMPPSCIIVIDNCKHISSSQIQDKLSAWTGYYRMWRNDLNQLFIVFNNESNRNSAITEIKRFGGRKANKNDSINANNAKKKNLQKKKKNQLKLQQKSQLKSNNNNQNNQNQNKKDGWNTIGNANATITVNNMPKKKDQILDIDMTNRFG